LQGDLVQWVEKHSVPRLISLDRAPKNKKALSKVFADKNPKVLGVMKADDKDLSKFQEHLIAASEKYSDLHVRARSPLRAAHPAVPACFALLCCQSCC
jgi:hypothetical protein